MRNLKYFMAVTSLLFLLLTCGDKKETTSPPIIPVDTTVVVKDTSSNDTLVSLNTYYCTSDTLVDDLFKMYSTIIAVTEGYDRELTKEELTGLLNAKAALDVVILWDSDYCIEKDKASKVDKVLLSTAEKTKQKWSLNKEDRDLFNEMVSYQTALEVWKKLFTISTKVDK